MRGRRPIATERECEEVFRLSDEGKSLRDVAELVFGDRRKKDRVARLLEKRRRERRFEEQLAKYGGDLDALVADALAAAERRLENPRCGEPEKPPGP